MKLAIIWSFAFVGKAQALLITEVMYSPEGSDSGREWVEIYNDSSETVDPASLRFFDGTRHRVTGQPIAPGEYAVLVGSLDKFRLDYPDVTGSLLDTRISIRNRGEVIRILTVEGRELASSFVSALSGADGNGFSLEWRDGAWQESAAVGGSPGQPPAADRVATVAIAEVVANPAENDEESIEFEGTGASDVTLIDGSGHRRRQRLRGRERLRRNRLGFALNNEAEMIRVVDHRGRELAATPIFVSRRRGERLRFEGGRFIVLQP